MPRIPTYAIARPGFGSLGAAMEEYEKCHPGDLTDGWGNPCPQVDPNSTNLSSLWSFLGLTESAKNPALPPGSAQAHVLPSVQGNTMTLVLVAGVIFVGIVLVRR